MNLRVVYRPNTVNFCKFVDSFDGLLHFLKFLKHECMLFGEFKIDTMGEGSKRRRYENLLAAYGFKVQNTS